MTNMGTTLLQILTSRRGLGALDPRDLVFANLGIASDCTGDRVDKGMKHQEQHSYDHPVDYQKPCVLVYTQEAKLFHFGLNHI